MLFFTEKDVSKGATILTVCRSYRITMPDLYQEFPYLYIKHSSYLNYITDILHDGACAFDLSHPQQHFISKKFWQIYFNKYKKNLPLYEKQKFFVNFENANKSFL